MNVQGNILDHEYKIEAGREKVAEVSKKWFRIRDTYGVEIEPGQDNATYPGDYGSNRSDGTRLIRSMWEKNG